MSSTWNESAWKSVLKRSALVFAGIFAAGLLVAAVQGPHGVNALLAKWEQIRGLEAKNADLSQRVAEQRKRNDDLGHSLDRQRDMIRQRLHKLLPDEIELKVPEPQVPDDPK